MCLRGAARVFVTGVWWSVSAADALHLLRGGGAGGDGDKWLPQAWAELALSRALVSCFHALRALRLCHPTAHGIG